MTSAGELTGVFSNVLILNKRDFNASRGYEDLLTSPFWLPQLLAGLTPGGSQRIAIE